MKSRVSYRIWLLAGVTVALASACGSGGSTTGTGGGTSSTGSPGSTGSTGSTSSSAGTGGAGAACPDNDGDGVPLCGGDCDDDDSTVFPGNTEICGDGKDNDCNGMVDEGCNGLGAHQGF